MSVQGAHSWDGRGGGCGLLTKKLKKGHGNAPQPHVWRQENPGSSQDSFLTGVRKTWLLASRIYIGTEDQSTDGPRT